MKTCYRCKESKPESEFYKCVAARDGLNTRCKLCVLGSQKEYRTRYPQNRRRSDEAYRRKNGVRPRRVQDRVQRNLSNNLRHRLRDALKIKQKIGSPIKELGCSVDELKAYLVSQFTDGMTWDNYGEWHIDHIKPLIGFDLTDKVQFLEACHYTNLQPLWAKKNLSKGSKVN